ncbi:hypothetical protein CAT723_18810 [Corynebacterium ammoniagenes]|uniref:Uncharacterized protein n=1 Tax=Corynebacterium ammoniagenes TaxID=1697 RepID=A0AAV5G9E4_CORAM|nr:hypothetical protein CAT723_18810 [Corynebacterium ammoniagenes]
MLPSVVARLNPYGESYITGRDCERCTLECIFHESVKAQIAHLLEGVIPWGILQGSDKSPWLKFKGAYTCLYKRAVTRWKKHWKTHWTTAQKTESSV